MITAIFQGFLLILVKIGMHVLWFLDLLTNFDLKKVSRTILYSMVFSFGIFFSYAIYSDYFAKLAEAFVGKNFYFSEPEARVYYPILIQNIKVPEISAEAVFVIDRGKSKVLYEFNADEKLAPASTVKLMTALVALDLYGPYDILTASEYCTQVEGTRAFFPEGTKFTVKDLIYSMLVSSAGDSACVLATNKISESRFVSLMNQKAKDIGMKNTYFSNPEGLDNINGGHYSTARDLYKLSNVAVLDPTIKSAVNTNSYLLRSLEGDFLVTLANTNNLLWQVPESVGIKTGTTEGAKEVLIYEYAAGKKDIVIIVMGSENRFYDTRSLLTWVLLSYSWD